MRPHRTQHVTFDEIQERQSWRGVLCQFNYGLNCTAPSNPVSERLIGHTEIASRIYRTVDGYFQNIFLSNPHWLPSYPATNDDSRQISLCLAISFVASIARSLSCIFARIISKVELIKAPLGCC